MIRPGETQAIPGAQYIPRKTMIAIYLFCEQIEEGDIQEWLRFDCVSEEEMARLHAKEVDITDLNTHILCTETLKGVHNFEESKWYKGELGDAGMPVDVYASLDAETSTPGFITNIQPCADPFER